jgi:hypothetical protein
MLRVFKQESLYIVEFEVVMNSTIFWDITSCSALKVYGRFGGTYLLATCFRAGFLLSLCFDPENGCDMFP